MCVCAARSACALGAGSWSAPVILLEDTGRYSSLEFDAQGRVHLAFYDYLNGDLWYGSRSPEADWVFETVDTEGLVGTFASLEVDPNGRAHIAYGELYDYKLKYAVRQGPDDWVIETVDAGSGRGWYSSLALDSAGRPHIAYSGNQEWDLLHAWHDGLTWRYETIESAGDVGLYCTLALNSADLGRISYCDKDNNHTKFAWQQSGGEWTTEVVDDSGDTGIDTTLVLDNDQNPHIAYWDRGNDALKYAWHDGQTWQTQIVEAGTDCGYEASIRWKDGPHISYEGSSGARYARNLGDGWQFWQIDQTGLTCGDTALALDAAGEPAIAYLNLGTGHLYYARDLVVPEPGGLVLLTLAGIVLGRRRPSRALASGRQGP